MQHCSSIKGVWERDLSIGGRDLCVWGWGLCVWGWGLCVWGWGLCVWGRGLWVWGRTLLQLLFRLTATAKANARAPRAEPLNPRRCV
uniref:Uncharacterized protein n=1 Tax=Knipowitschia caucasica TaxID=637954 RepID=A0AAV2K243_KNICA